MHYVVRDERFDARQDAVSAARRVASRGESVLIFRVNRGQKQVDSICGNVRGRFMCELPKKHASAWPLRGQLAMVMSEPRQRRRYR